MLKLNAHHSSVTHLSTITTMHTTPSQSHHLLHCTHLQKLKLDVGRMFILGGLISQHG